MKVGEDLALIQLEGVWQNRLATFKDHGNINIRDEMEWSEKLLNILTVLGIHLGN